MKYFNLIALLILTTIACENRVQEEPSKTKSNYPFEIQNLSDDEYPDNTDIGYRTKDYNNQYFKSGNIKKNDTTYSIVFNAINGDSIVINKLDLNEYIPTLPAQLKKDDYISYLTLVNQEWNRNQVQFNPKEFVSNNKKIVRVDLARNCLNSYLWEIIVYSEENGTQLPTTHGLFNFPKELYANLFKEINNISFDKYSASLEHWKDPKSKIINPSVLRTVIDSQKISFIDLSDEMYPVKKARKKKFKEIISPEKFNTMRDLQTDSTLFATFSIPGFYNKKEPRKTELGRIHQLKNVKLNKIISQINQDTLYELKLVFRDKTKQRETQLIIGGINLADFPVFTSEDANNGWKSSMGFSNHTFYETYNEHQQCKTKNNPYYAYLTDGQGKWLDSHKIGIDGSLFHFSDKNRKTLNLWLLSFERHALVGHYSITLN